MGYTVAAGGGCPFGLVTDRTRDDARLGGRRESRIATLRQLYFQIYAVTTSAWLLPYSISCVILDRTGEQGSCSLLSKHCASSLFSSIQEAYLGAKRLRGQVLQALRKIGGMGKLIRDMRVRKTSV